MEDAKQLYVSYLNLLKIPAIDSMGKMPLTAFY